MTGHFIPPDFSKGDPGTLGGYMAVHDRPAAFEGSDGFSYSVAIEADLVERGEYAAWLLFLRWRRVGPQGVEGHIESDYLARGATPGEARDAVGRMPLGDVKALLDRLIAARPEPPQRRWWDVMREDDA